VSRRFENAEIRAKLQCYRNFLAWTLVMNGTELCMSVFVVGFAPDMLRLYISKSCETLKYKSNETLTVKQLFRKTFLTWSKFNKNVLLMAFTKLNDGIVNLLQQLEFCLVSLALPAYWKTFTQKYGFLSENVWRVSFFCRSVTIPKVHSPSSSSEYRPISVLPVLSKLFEKVVYHRVYSYLTEHNLIDKRQYGFR